jgi:hypothetical protein
MQKNSGAGNNAPRRRYLLIGGVLVALAFLVYGVAGDFIAAQVGGLGYGRGGNVDRRGGNSDEHRQDDNNRSPEDEDDCNYTCEDDRCRLDKLVCLNRLAGSQITLDDIETGWDTINEVDYLGLMIINSPAERNLYTFGSIGDFYKLRTLQITNALNLKESIPGSELVRIEDLETLKILATGVTGTLPVEIAQKNGSFHWVEIAMNRDLSGEIPNEYYQSETFGIRAKIFGSNSLGGVLPDELLENGGLINLSNNAFYGRVPNPYDFEYSDRMCNLGNNFMPTETDIHGTHPCHLVEGIDVPQRSTSGTPTIELNRNTYQLGNESPVRISAELAGAAPVLSDADKTATTCWRDVIHSGVDTDNDGSEDAVNIPEWSGNISVRDFVDGVENGIDKFISADSLNSLAPGNYRFRIEGCYAFPEDYALGANEEVTEIITGLEAEIEIVSGPQDIVAVTGVEPNSYTKESETGEISVSWILNGVGTTEDEDGNIACRRESLDPDNNPTDALGWSGNFQPEDVTGEAVNTVLSTAGFDDLATGTYTLKIVDCENYTGEERSSEFTIYDPEPELSLSFHDGDPSTATYELGSGGEVRIDWVTNNLDDINCELHQVYEENDTSQPLPDGEDNYVLINPDDELSAREVSFYIAGCLGLPDSEYGANEVVSNIITLEMVDAEAGEPLVDIVQVENNPYTKWSDQPAPHVFARLENIDMTTDENGYVSCRSVAYDSYGTEVPELGFNGNITPAQIRGEEIPPQAILTPNNVGAGEYTLAIEGCHDVNGEGEYGDEITLQIYDPVPDLDVRINNVAGVYPYQRGESITLNWNIFSVDNLVGEGDDSTCMRYSNPALAEWNDYFKKAEVNGEGTVNIPATALDALPEGDYLFQIVGCESLITAEGDHMLVDSEPVILSISESDEPVVSVSASQGQFIKWESGQVPLTASWTTLNVDASVDENGDTTCERVTRKEGNVVTGLGWDGKLKPNQLGGDMRNRTVVLTPNDVDAGRYWLSLEGCKDSGGNLIESNVTDIKVYDPLPEIELSFANGQPRKVYTQGVDTGNVEIRYEIKNVDRSVDGINRTSCYRNTHGGTQGWFQAAEESYFLADELGVEGTYSIPEAYLNNAPAGLYDLNITGCFSLQTIEGNRLPVDSEYLSLLIEEGGEEVEANISINFNGQPSYLFTKGHGAEDVVVNYSLEGASLDVIGSYNGEDRISCRSASDAQINQWRYDTSGNTLAGYFTLEDATEIYGVKVIPDWALRDIRAGNYPLYIENCQNANGDVIDSVFATLKIKDPDAMAQLPGSPLEYVQGSDTPVDIPFVLENVNQTPVGFDGENEYISCHVNSYPAGDPTGPAISGFNYDDNSYAGYFKPFDSELDDHYEGSVRLEGNKLWGLNNVEPGEYTLAIEGCTDFAYNPVPAATRSLVIRAAN